MKNLLRLIGVAIAACSLIVVVTVTVAVVKKVWLGGKGGGGLKGHIAVVDLKGMITDATSFNEKMKDALEDENAKGVIVKINSPGGMVGPSQEMLQAIRKVDAKKPVYISMGAVAASGGYYAACGGRKIYANPGTLTASIGVIAEFVNTEKLFNWAKVERTTLKAGKMKDVGSPTRPMTKEERAFLEAMLADIHQEFQKTVKDARKLSDEEVAGYLDGRVMTGSQASKVKLVDSLGGYEQAAADLKKAVNLPPDADEVKLEDEEGVLQKVLWGQGHESKLGWLPDFLGFQIPKDGKDILMSQIPLTQGWTVMALAPISIPQ